MSLDIYLQMLVIFPSLFLCLFGQEKILVITHSSFLQIYKQLPQHYRFLDMLIQNAQTDILKDNNPYETKNDKPNDKTKTETPKTG